MKNNSQNLNDSFDLELSATDEEIDCSSNFREEEPSLDRQQIGVVTDCVRLNIREEPSVDAAVITVITALSEVAVDQEASTEDFYRVCTESGIEGFCMKRYIALRK